jgi:hypothetical protein
MNPNVLDFKTKVIQNNPLILLADLEYNIAKSLGLDWTAPLKSASSELEMTSGFITK